MPLKNKHLQLSVYFHIKLPASLFSRKAVKGLGLLLQGPHLLFQGFETSLQLLHGGSSSAIGIGKGLWARTAGDTYMGVGIGASVAGWGAGVNRGGSMAPRAGFT